MKKVNLKPNVRQWSQKAKSIIAIVILLLTIVTTSYAQEEPDEEVPCDYLCPQLHGNPMFLADVYTADELWQTLSCLYIEWQNSLGNNLDCGLDNKAYTECGFPMTSCTSLPSPWNCLNPITIRIHGRLEMGELDASIYPIEVAPNVILQGTFDIGGIKGGYGSSVGTRINFPYLYEIGLENNAIYGPGLPTPSTSCSQDKACVFKLRDGCKFRNICLTGPQDYYSDRRWDAFRDCANPNLTAPRTSGLVGGINVLGNQCEISYCEISNFNLWGVSVEDMVVTDPASNASNYVCYTTCYAPDATPGQEATYYGKFEFHHNYVHGCKSSGFSYGLWVSPGSGATSCDLANPNPSCAGAAPANYDFINFKAPDEVAYVNNNVFADNTMDIDGTGYRLSFVIENNTFSHNNGNNNFHLHNGSNGTIDLATCNPMHGAANPLEPIVHLNTQGEPDVGGQQVTLNHNTFYKPKLNIDFTYPNINICTFQDPGGIYYPNLDGGAFIQMNNNYFSTPWAVRSNLANDDLDWTVAGSQYRQGHGKVQISEKWHFNYLIKGQFPAGDNNIQIDENALLPSNKCQTVPFDAVSLTPQTIIASVSDIHRQNGTPSDETDKLIEQGETVWFDSKMCKDKLGIAAGSSTHALLNIWKLNEPATMGGYMEARADKTNAVTPMPYTFNHIGINYVTLTNFDMTSVQQTFPPINQQNTNDWRASDVAVQQITVTPPNPCGHAPVLTFWIKDNYNNLNIAGHGLHGHGVLDVSPNPTPVPFTGGGPTGFEKYAAVSTDGGATWTDVWVQDIADEVTGWQYVMINSSLIPLTGRLEIGLRTRGLAPDATRVRGVTIYVDDVYINNWHCGWNVIENGGFETGDQPDPIDPENPTSNWVDVWQSASWPPSCNTPPCPFPFTYGGGAAPCQFTWSQSGMTRTTEEVRSGRYAVKGWVKPVSNEQDVHPIPGNGTLTYAPNQIYHKIFTDYRMNPHRIGQNSTFTFTVLPSPAKAGQIIKLLCNHKPYIKKNMEIISATGKVVTTAAFSEAVYTFTAELKPGVYFVKVTEGNTMAMQKLVITN